VALNLFSWSTGIEMTIKYLKKAEKTPQTGSDETRNIVADMLAKIEAGGEEVALAYGRDLDGYSWRCDRQ
jgi:sulfopropanediol 3-dehydrogenase